MRVDTTPPVVTLVGVLPRVFSPDGDGRQRPGRGEVPARREGATDTPRRRHPPGARTLRQARGASSVVRQARRQGSPPRSSRSAFGRSTRRETAPRELAAVPVRARFVELGRNRVEAVAGERFSIFVSTDADSYDWLFAGKRGHPRAAGPQAASSRTAGHLRPLREGRRPRRPRRGRRHRARSGPVSAPLFVLGVSRSGRPCCASSSIALPGSRSRTRRSSSRSSRIGTGRRSIRRASSTT